MHERIARERPKRKVAVEEAANEALEAVEEIQGVLERVHEISDALNPQEQMRDVLVTLDNLWMVTFSSELGYRVNTPFGINPPHSPQCSSNGYRRLLRPKLNSARRASPGVSRDGPLVSHLRQRAV
jgi:hypothetical protein